MSLKTTAPFFIYDAAAGSGKTYSLVKRYLSALLQQPKDSYYRQLLALTFTNKAVAEMKERIVDSLVEFADERVLSNAPPMFLDIAKTLQLEPLVLHKRASDILRHLLHNYAAFSVETIDSFNHRLIRTFAKDLKLPSNFEVMLDIDALLTEAVDALINKAGTDVAITKVLVDFAIEKTDDDRSWDISFDLFAVSKMLANEEDAAHLIKLKDKSLSDFILFKQELSIKYKKISEEIIDKAKVVNTSIEAHELIRLDFSSGYFYDHFVKLARGNFDVNLQTKWILNIRDKDLYSGKVRKERPDAADAIDELTPGFIEIVDSTSVQISTLLFIDAVLRKITPISVINLVQKELEAIKVEQNVLPLFQFNAIINKEIKNQPAPFIYERMGERYRHIFVDEFQDTSVMQWENLHPLIENTLTQTQDSKEGSLLLVGDVKQAIYRWRGGKPEQFLDMINGHSPFPSVQPQVENLPVNYRSLKEVVTFNNTFFTYISGIFNNPMHQELYVDGNHQDANKDQEGYVEMSFVVGANKEEKQEEYKEKTLSTIQNLLENDFSYSDICILTRRRADGIVLSEFLMEHEIPVISSETLLLEQSGFVQAIIGLLQVSVSPQDKETLVAVLDFLYDHLEIKEDKHFFFTAFTEQSTAAFPEIIEAYNIVFSWEKLRASSVYESAEYIIEQFGFADTADAYLFGFMDFIFEYEQQAGADTLGFLTHWEKKREKASISSGTGTDGVQFMTIHKSKGLEFPVVIFPFADVTIYKENQATTWIPLPDEWQLGFEETLINYSSKVAGFSEAGSELHNVRRETLQLDNLNLLYVTLTRAVEQLYIFSETPSTIKTGDDIKTFPQAFKGFLESQSKWDGEDKVYTFGTFQKKQLQKEAATTTVSHPTYICIAPEQHDIKVITKDAMLWGTNTQEAIDTGNLVHNTMELIKHKSDITMVFSALQLGGSLSASAFASLKGNVLKIVNNPELAPLFENFRSSENERDIITKDGRVLRPDRLVFHEDNSVTVLDYKTGSPNYDHEEQITSYATALIDMGFVIRDKILVYTNEEIVVNKVNLGS